MCSRIGNGIEIICCKAVYERRIITYDVLAFISPIIVSGQTNIIRQLTMSSTLQDLLILIILSDTLQHDIWINRDTVLLTKVGGESKADEK